MAFAALVGVVPLLARGTGTPAAFLLGMAIVAVWAGVAVHAYRRAVSRRARLDLPGPDGGAIGVLWLAPVAIVVSALVWGVGGAAADPASVLDRYVDDWRHRRGSAAAERFVRDPGGADVVAGAWERQAVALRAELVRLAAQSPPGSGIDPARPFETVRWVDAGPLTGGGRRVLLEVARRERVHGELLGFLPATSERVVPVAVVGSAELRPVPVALPAPFERLPVFGEVVLEEWRVVRVEIAGVALGG